MQDNNLYYLEAIHNFVEVSQSSLRYCSTHIDNHFCSYSFNLSLVNHLIHQMHVATEGSQTFVKFFVSNLQGKMNRFCIELLLKVIS